MLRVIDDFVKTHNLERYEGVSILTDNDITQLRTAGVKCEALFNHLSKHCGILLHGSPTNIKDDYLKSTYGNGEIYASNLGSIAILTAILSHKVSTLYYPLIIDGNNPLTVEIENINAQTISEKGFVYLIGDRLRFVNAPSGSYQYITERKEVPFTAKIPVLKSDFLYPIYDLTNNLQIQG
jgi:hypothetical protein